MLRYALIFWILGHSFGSDSAKESKDLAKRELRVELTLRNLLIIRETFPKVESFWVEIAMMKKKDNLRLRVASFLVKGAFKMLRGPVTNLARSGVRAGVKQGKGFLKDSAIDMAQDTLANVAANEVQLVGEMLDATKMIQKYDPNATFENYWVCIGPSIEMCGYVLVKMRTRPMKMVDNILNNLADPKRTVRNIIRSVSKQVKKYQDQHSKNSLRGPLLLRAAMKITAKLAALCEPLVIRSVIVNED